MHKIISTFDEMIRIYECYLFAKQRPNLNIDICNRGPISTISAQVFFNHSILESNRAYQTVKTHKISS